jgi:hypothetical protein
MMLGTIRVSRIGMSHLRQFGTSLGGSVEMIMGSPFNASGSLANLHTAGGAPCGRSNWRYEAAGRATYPYHQCPSRARLIAGLSRFLTLSQSRDGPDL